MMIAILTQQRRVVDDVGVPPARLVAVAQQRRVQVGRGVGGLGAHGAVPAGGPQPRHQPHAAPALVQRH